MQWMCVFLWTISTRLISHVSITDIYWWGELRRSIYTLLWFVRLPSVLVPVFNIWIVGDAILGSDLGISLKGLAIGNGWIDAKHQYPAYLEYSVKHGIIEENSEVCLFAQS